MLLAYIAVAATVMQLALGLVGELGQPWALRSWIAFTLVPLVVYLLCSLFVMRARTPDRGWLLALLAVVFGLSLGVIRVVERVTPPAGAALPSVSSAMPEADRATLREVRALVPDQTTCRRVRSRPVRSAPRQSGPVRTRATQPAERAT